MEKKIVLFTSTLLIFSMLNTSCEKKTDDPVDPPKTIIETETPDTTKPAVTTFRFAATNKDCGLTDGFANQQHSLPKLVHLNTDKCNGESFRPTITLNFEEAPVAGTYQVLETPVSAKEVRVISDQYNFTNWVATGGSVEVTVNAEDSTKVDIQFKSIEMRNENSSTDTNNPATDILTGFIIKI